jgi:predicted phage terminase large subunit-like protein
MSKEINKRLIHFNLAHQCMAEFATYTDDRYQMNWHHSVLCDLLDRFVEKDIRRLMVFMPPRHGKSELVSRKLPAFIFGKDPDASVIATSYSADLAQRMNRDVQRIIDSPTYGELFPQTSLNGKNIRTMEGGSYLRNSDIFEIVGHRGTYRGVGGGITGMGGDYIIIDDPIKNREEANSLTYRDKLWDWYTSTLSTRQEKNAAILITLTRWHEDDLAGRLLELAKADPTADQWEILMLPAICEDDTRHRDDPRENNMALWPDKYTYAELMRIKSTIGIYDWSAMYQQGPQPAGGTIFRREWMNRDYMELPAGAQTIQSWDLPFKNSEASAKCAGIIMARHGAELFFVDVVNDKMSFTDSVTAIRGMTAKHPRARAKVVEDKANGPAIISYLQKEIPGMIAYNPKGSKEDRALSVAPYFEAGNVYFPKYAPWKGDLIDDLLRFPTGVYKDTVDATVQAILYLMDKPRAHLGDIDKTLGKESYWRR